MVFVAVPAARLSSLETFLRERGILILGRSSTLRLVTHLDVDEAGIDRTVAAFGEYYRR
jgi:threonine aldolase